MSVAAEVMPGPSLLHEDRIALVAVAAPAPKGKPETADLRDVVPAEE